MENKVIDILHRAYSLSKKSDEVIGGRFADDFAGKVTWSRALDLDVPGHPNIQGLRYMDFKDCTNVHILYKDGESRFMETASPDELEALVEAVKARGLKVPTKDPVPFWDEDAAGDDLGWCEEAYTLRFSEKDRRDFPPDDPVYKAAHMLSAWLDAEESGYTEGVPLGLVMDELGYKGGRDGLTVDSVVKDVLVGGDGLSFKVEDNFSDFDVCRCLANRLGVDIDVSATYRFGEFEGLDHDSGEQKFVARSTKGLAEKLEGRIQLSLDSFSRKGDVVPVLSFEPYRLMAVESFGPEADRINLVGVDTPLSGEQERSSVRIGEINDPFMLERLLNIVDSNFERLANEVQRRWVPSEASAVEPDSGVDLSDGAVPSRYAATEEVAMEREGVLKSLYGSSSAYQNISEYMEGFDISIDYAANRPLTREEAIEAASHAETADGGVTDLSEEVRFEIDMNGHRPDEALQEWDIEQPQACDRLVLHYDGDRMMEFDIRDDGPWTARNVDGALVDFFQERTGVDLREKFGFGRDYVGTEGKKVMEVCVQALTSPQNCGMIKDATRKAARRARHREMAERFESGLGKGRDKSKGIR